MSGDSIRREVERNLDAQHSLKVISTSCEGDCYLVGGAIRDAILKSGTLRDLDIVIFENDQRVFGSLDAIGATFEFNRRGMRRYRYGELQMDLIEPSKFYQGLSTIDEILGFFDLKINALGLHLGTNAIIDPLGSRECYADSEVGINWFRWDSPQMTLDERWLLLLRLVRLAERYPAFHVETESKERLKVFISKLENTKWDWCDKRFPPGEAILLEKARSLFY